MLDDPMLTVVVWGAIPIVLCVYIGLASRGVGR